MVAPGLAGLETVMTLHDAARIAHPRATFGVIEGNPIHEDIREISRMTGVDFSVDVTLNRDQKITAAFAGDLFQEHAAACASAREKVMRAVEAPFDVVLTTNSGLSARSEPLPGGKRNVCRREGREGRRDDHLRGGVSGRHPQSRAVRGTSEDAQHSPRTAGHDYDARIFACRSVAGADSGTDSAQGSGCWSRQMDFPRSSFALRSSIRCRM
jgi:hypothetical protein